MLYSSTTSSKLHLHPIFIVVMICVCWTYSQRLTAQVSYDNNGTTMGAASGSAMVQGAFNVPAGDDRLLVVFVTRDADGSATDSVTFNGQQLTKQTQNAGGSVGLTSEIWYLTMGCGNAVSSSVAAHFSGTLGMLDVIVGASTFQNVDQATIFGPSVNADGQGSMAGPVSVSTTDTSGLRIALISTDVNSGGPASVTPSGPSQTEIYEGGISNNSGEGSYKPFSGGGAFSWNFNVSCTWQVAAIELLSSDMDGDGVPDCSDLCPGIPDTDTDGDGTPDCVDNCPDDPLKTEPGICGCGFPDSGDIDGDGVLDCVDICVDIADPGQEDSDGDGVGDVCDNCVSVPNANQSDIDGDGIGDQCDEDHFVIEVFDPDSNLLWGVNDEGFAGSITLRDSSTSPAITHEKLYAVNGLLHYNGGVLAPIDSLLPLILDGQNTLDTLLEVKNASNAGMKVAGNTTDGIYVEANGGDGIKLFHNEESGIESSNNFFWGLFTHSNDVDGVFSTNNGLHGVVSSSNSFDGVVSSNNGRIGVISSSNDSTGIISQGNFDHGVVSSSNDRIGIISSANDSFGILSQGNLNHGIVSSFNSETGLTSFGNDFSGLRTSNNGTSGVFISDNGGNGVYSIDNALDEGYFSGTVTVTGNLSKGGGSFKIDHPLDPENKFLYHSFVESPDMMNIYNGNAVLDANGEAVVEMEDWFEPLNRDLRYQLTCIGEFAPVYIADEMQGNQFRIAGGSPGMKVSWQVTGIRQDPYANANRIEVEVDKPAEFKGYYIHPEVYGRGFEQGFDFVKLGHKTLEELREESEVKFALSEKHQENKRANKAEK